MVNLSFLTGRSPIIIPSGILPSEFVAQEGGVYDSFAVGLPAVISLNGQFYPLTPEEVSYLKQQFSPQVSSGGPESIPQMPAMPTMPDQLDDLRKFEQKAEQAAEQKQEEQTNQAAPAAPATPQPTSPIEPPKPQVLVKAEEVLSHGRELVSQKVLDDSYKQFKQGQLRPKSNTGDEAIEWLRWLLLKAFEEQEKR